MGTEVDQQSMFLPRRLQVTDNLCLVFRCKRLGGIEFDDELMVPQQVGKILANFRAILVENMDRGLPDRPHPGFAQPVPQCIHPFCHKPLSSAAKALVIAHW